MFSEETKRNNELVWAAIFTAEINKQHNFDYTIVPEKGENSNVDVYLVSKSKKFPQLQLQLTHAVELPFIAYEEPVAANYTKQPTLDAINRKCEKLQRQGADLSKLILIIQGYMSPTSANFVFTDPDFDPVKKYDFAGVYYVSPPMLSEDTSEELQNGFVVTLKNAFPD